MRLTTTTSRRLWEMMKRQLTQSRKLSPFTWYQTVWRSSRWTLVSDRLAIRRRCFDRLKSRSSRVSNAQDVETILKQAAPSRRRLSVAPTSTTGRGRKSLVSSVAALGVTVAWTIGFLSILRRKSCRCRPCRPPADGRSTVKKLEKMRSVQSSPCMATARLISSSAPTSLSSRRGRVTVETVGRMTSYFYDVTIGLMR